MPGLPPRAIIGRRETGFPKTGANASTRQTRKPTNALLAFAALLLFTSCEREKRELRLDPPIASALDEVAVMPNGIGGAPPQIYSALDQPYTSNAYSLSQGK